jgi:chromosome segregation ATPase
MTERITEQVVFQAKAHPEGRSRVYLGNQEEADGILAHLIAKDFKLGSNGDSLYDVSRRLEDQEKKIERLTTALSKEMKAVHRRMDHGFPSLDARLSTLEDKLAEMVNIMEETNVDLSTYNGNLVKVEKNVAQLNYETENLTDVAALCEESHKDMEAMAEYLQDHMQKLSEDIIQLRQFNKKVVLFGDPDDETPQTRTEPEAVLPDQGPGPERT